MPRNELSARSESGKIDEGFDRECRPRECRIVWGSGAVAAIETGGLCVRRIRLRQGIWELGAWAARGKVGLSRCGEARRQSQGAIVPAAIRNEAGGVSFEPVVRDGGSLRGGNLKAEEKEEHQSAHGVILRADAVTVEGKEGLGRFPGITWDRSGYRNFPQADGGAIIEATGRAARPA